MNITKTTPRETHLIRFDIYDALQCEDGTLSADLLEELDGWEHILEDYRFYPMEEFDERMKNYRPSELASMISNGWDTQHRAGSFDPDQGYFTFDSHGNLVSAEWRDYSGFYDKYLLDALLEYRNQLHTLDEWDELVQLLDELADAKEFWEETI